MHKTIIAATIAALGLVGCGGSPGGGKHGQAVCADFQYQEDAQDAYRAGEKQLDGDNDGRACEVLAHRPVDPSEQPNTPGNPSKYKPVLFIADTPTGGVYYAFKPAGPWGPNVTTLQPDGYSIEHSSGGSTGPFVPTIKDGVTDLGGNYRFYETSDSTHLLWMKSEAQGITGLGVTGTKIQVAEISGNYKLLGKKCSSSQENNWAKETCVPVTSSGYIDSSGRLNICVNAEYSATCPGHSSQLLTARTDGDSLSYNENNVYGYVIASKLRGTVALTNTTPTYTDGKQTSVDHYVYFGQLDQVTDTSMKFSEMVSFDDSGNIVAGIPETQNWAVQQAEVPGFFKDTAGNIFLASSTGQLITWTQNTATLKEYSKR